MHRGPRRCAENAELGTRAGGAADFVAGSTLKMLVKHG